MYTVSRKFTFCYAHRLLNHTGKCAGLHGHNGTIQIKLCKDRLNAQGMVADFVEIKKTLGVWIDENLDHRVILEEHDPLTKVLLNASESVFFLRCAPTAENLARLVFEQAEKFDLPVLSVTFWETEKCAAEYSK